MAAAAPIIALISLGLVLVGVLGATLGILPPLTGFYAFAAGGIVGGLFSIAVALIGLFTTRGGRNPEGRTRALIGLAIALALPIIVLAPAAMSPDVPPINDITTDLEDPPAFADADLVPEFRGRDMSYPPEFVEIVRAAYPNLTSRRVDAAPADAFLLAVRTAESLGWDIVAKDGGAGAFYAREESSIFRFVDDIVVRIRPDGTGSRIDVRSKSRDGRGDMGVNAARIEMFMDALDQG